MVPGDRFGTHRGNLFPLFITRTTNLTMGGITFTPTPKEPVEFFPFP